MSKWILRLCVCAPNALTTSMSKTSITPDSALLAGTITLIALLAGAAGAAEAENPGAEGDGKFTIGPEYKIDPDLTDRGNPKGKSFEFSMRLADSKIFRGDDSTLEPQKKAVRKERRIFVYVPAGYHDGAKAPILIIHDGPGQLKLVGNALDNLTISKDPNRKLPPFIAIAVENGGNDGKKSERGLEYDTMSDRLARFIADEVAPKMKAAGLKPVTIWVPDVNAPGFKEEVARAIEIINNSAGEKVILEQLLDVDIEGWK